MTDKKKDIQLPPNSDFIKDLTVDELKEWCEIYGTKKGKNKSEVIANIITSPDFQAETMLKMIPIKKKLMNFKVSILSQICEDIGETKKGTKKELTIRILRKNPNIDISKYSKLEELSEPEIEGNPKEASKAISVQPGEVSTKLTTATDEEFKKMIEQAVQASLEGKIKSIQPGEPEPKCDCLCNKCESRVKRLEETVSKLCIELAHVILQINEKNK